MTADAAELISLIEAGDLDSLSAALDAGGDPASADRWGVSLLMHAAAEGRADMVRLLLDRGAAVDHACDAGNSALMMATAAGHREIVDQLMAAGAEPGHANKWGFSAKDWGAWADNSAEILSRLRDGA